MRRPRFLPLVKALGLALPVLEVLVIIEVARLIGVGLTFLLLVAGAIGGGLLIRREGERSVRAMVGGWRQGAPTADGLARSGWVVLAGVLLAIPGFITDVLAGLILLPVTRRLVARAMRRSRPLPAEPTVVRGDVV